MTEPGQNKARQRNTCCCGSGRCEHRHVLWRFTYVLCTCGYLYPRPESQVCLFAWSPAPYSTTKPEARSGSFIFATAKCSTPKNLKNVRRVLVRFATPRLFFFLSCFPLPRRRMRFLVCVRCFPERVSQRAGLFLEEL